MFFFRGSVGIDGGRSLLLWSPLEEEAGDPAGKQAGRLRSSAMSCAGPSAANPLFTSCFDVGPMKSRTIPFLGQIPTPGLISHLRSERQLAKYAIRWFVVLFCLAVWIGLAIYLFAS